MGYPPGGGSRAIGSCGRADSSPVPTTTTMSLFSVVYGGGSASRQTILEPALISRRFEDARSAACTDTGLLVAPALASLLPRTQVLRHRDSGVSTLELSRP